MGGRLRWGLAAVLAIGSAGVAQPAAAPSLTAMRGVAPGNWSLRSPGSAEAARESCVADTAVLFRLRLRATQCSRFVIEDTPRIATVHYTCPGAGHVRTTIHVDTPRALRIESEGIVDGMPFADAFEARRLGDCNGRGR
ncbi:MULTISPECIES: hypothetical protein [unclassified Sphingomonas]|uniref:hypothetical protein n=1 Tax=unclassified Sphingomonas TaxID=196159 RepID=UPI0006FE34D9|nr:MULTISPECIES: hypothetical protein [unclassified Sphingomonas]KQM64738.1 hypothetical protein ASE65_15885 [Sphingomonas sp. Leaf16]KQN16871.1 hypothetical protein ASE81_15935 [Sphingomonas sp. Leaf29]KQN22852.1 hypothetical protein ASE83_15860 [Sphingomonas sp. Leaf32]